MRQTIAKVHWMHEKCTKDFRRYCLVGNDAEDCRLGVFQDSFSCWRCAAFEVDVWRHGLRIGQSRNGNNEVDVQESSRRLRSGSESEIILPGACSRKDDSPCLKTLGECGSETIPRKSGKGGLGHQRRGPHDISPVNVNELDPKSIGRVPTNIPHFSFPVQLCIFADGAAAIHMVIKDRSLHVRDATRPRSVYFHCCLSESICDRTISIRYAQTTDRMAEMFTQGAPTSAQ